MQILRRSVPLALRLALTLLVAPGFAQAGEVKVAVAANFTETAKRIATAFEKKTGHTVTQSFGASGQFYAQITHGAPFEVFLSADAERPVRLDSDGLTVKGTRFVYAYGKLVLWSADKRVDAKGAVLSKGTFDKLAIADPAAAPYGAAAVETLTRLGLYDRLQSKIVKGGNIAQTYTFIATGAAELGFVALSQTQGKGGSSWVVPANLYSPIDQQAVLLKTGADNPAAKAYMAFLRSPEAVTIIRSHGYEVR
ncbi:molybdate ABC transporter substrate-binding protein [Asticcacaulis sp. AND118]|uniref:molybdate ABC transporter substrate-binding protein n=1 Tax=Asticcacaulis sp. AND118 TaxID=2840468 RepID=UPI001CFF8678|nr:molybdate ABC transporter substrate-binding protein [Asticcacaulis sp. AND118]UDF03133.1 molybdate ABC transporter substrate-binding protein [Asticcacaulis sp. AND118]